MARRLGENHNRHHAWWTDRAFNCTPDHYALKTQESQIAVMRMAGHVALHKACDPPPLPTQWMARELVYALNTDKPDRGVEGVEYSQAWMLEQAIDGGHSESDQERMFAIAHQLGRQLVFLRGDYGEAQIHG